MGENYLEFCGYNAICENISRNFFYFLILPYPYILGGKVTHANFFPAKIPILRLSQKFSATKKFCYAGMHTLNNSCMYVRQNWT